MATYDMPEYKGHTITVQEPILDRAVSADSYDNVYYKVWRDGDSKKYAYSGNLADAVAKARLAIDLDIANAKLAEQEHELADLRRLKDEMTYIVDTGYKYDAVTAIHDMTRALAVYAKNQARLTEGDAS